MTSLDDRIGGLVDAICKYARHNGVHLSGARCDDCAEIDEIVLEPEEPLHWERDALRAAFRSLLVEIAVHGDGVHEPNDGPFKSSAKSCAECGHAPGTWCPPNVLDKIEAALKMRCD